MAVPITTPSTFAEVPSSHQIVLNDEDSGDDTDKPSGCWLRGACDGGGDDR